MAANNIRILKDGQTVQRARVEANITLGIREGDAMKAAAGSGTNYAALLLTGDPEQATDIFLGVSKSGATNTALVDGIIDVEICVPGTILEAKATTATNVNTDAKLLALLFDHVSGDRSAATAAGVWTLDSNEGTDADVHGFMILDGRITDGMMFFTPANAWIGRGLV
ncbi:hypothetical protein LCGC14_2735990 [marine sediment metagenome]|uniref:Uncharacterized protein n=1 Tax=marine sediment metagenome TaxID=412755 RepID=A0A0F9BXI2_9ZZZZ